MNQARYTEVMDGDSSVSLTKAEMAEGWHFCNEFDGLLVGPEMGELQCCKCLPPDHPVYRTYPARIGMDWLADSSLEKWFPITAEEFERLRSKMEMLMSAASEQIGFDPENQCGICHCCGMELENASGHRQNCLANLILNGRP